MLAYKDVVGVFSFDSAFSCVFCMYYHRVKTFFNDTSTRKSHFESIAASRSWFLGHIF